MKSIKHLLTAAFFFFSFAAHTQNSIPKGFEKGTIVLTNGDMVTGFFKDNLRKDASVLFISEAGAKKKKYQGTDIASAEINDSKYLCIKGDFFKIICNGNLCFLQKSSDASGIPFYNGSEAIFCNGTEGQPGDYFIYSTTAKQLKRISRQTIEEVAATSFEGCTAAIDKAKTVKDDLGELKEAVDIYNSLNN